MKFTELTEIELPAAYDAHVHLRDGEMSQLVTPTIRKGGVNQVYVMVSLVGFVSHPRFRSFHFRYHRQSCSSSSSLSVHVLLPICSSRNILVTFL